jgi:hypothetical protein
VDKVEQLYNAIPNKRAKIDSTKPDATEILGNVHKDLRQNAWRDLSRKLDGLHSKKRSFRKIALLYSKPTQLSLDLGGVLGSLSEVGNKDLKSSTAVKMNLGGTQNGKLFFHSTAVYLEPSAEYLFLDPNYGIFAFSDQGLRSKLVTARPPAVVSDFEWEWCIILTLWSPLQVIRLLEDSSEQAVRLHQNSPFTSLLPVPLAYRLVE